LFGCPIPLKRALKGQAQNTPTIIYIKSSINKFGLSKKVSKFKTNTMYKGNQSNKTKRANNLFNLYEDIFMLNYN
tara:strand:+ start:669 stop:893 length:225 start_codon:yes stop_codon:yes gene_type:complete